jgi:hypothetical protein
LYAQRYPMSCLLVSSSVLARHEGLVLLLVWGIILWVIHRRRRFLDLLALAVFPLLWNLWGYVLTGDPTFIITSAYPIATAPYGHGGWFDYLIGLLQYEPVIFPLAVLGGGLTASRGGYRPLHLLLALYFGFNVVAWRFGLFGTAGLLRYFVPVLPLMAIYAALAFDYSNLLLAYKRLASYGLNPLLLQVVFTLLVLNSHTGGYHLRNTPTVDRALIEAGQWIRANCSEEYVYASHPALLYYAGRDFYSSAMVWNPAPVRQEGIVAFESGFGSPELLRYLEHFQLLKVFGDHVFIYDHSLTSIEARPTINFWSEDIRPHLGEGWSDPEDWGTWAEGLYSEFTLYFREPRTVTITVSVIPQLVPGRQQSIRVYYNNVPVGSYEFPEGDQNAQQVSFSVPKSLVSAGPDVIKFVYEYAVSPMDLGASNDSRQLAVGFLDMSIVVEQ